MLDNQIAGGDSNITKRDMDNARTIKAQAQEILELKAYAKDVREVFIPAVSITDRNGEHYCVVDPECVQELLDRTPSHSLTSHNAAIEEDVIGQLSATLAIVADGDEIMLQAARIVMYHPRKYKEE